MKNCTEEYFYKLRLAFKKEFNPTEIYISFFAEFFVAAFVAFITCMGDRGYIPKQIWIRIVDINIIILSIQLIIAFFFMNLKNSFKYQKVQAILLCLTIFKFSIEMYQIFFEMCVRDKLPNYMYYLGVSALLIGIILLCILILRAIKRVEKGYFKENGKGLYSFEGYGINGKYGLAFGFVMFAGLIGRHVSESHSSIAHIIGAIFFLAIVIAVQYAIYIVLPKFFLFAYCKFRFKSFIEEISKEDKEKRSATMRNNIKTMNGSLYKWYSMPIKTLESFAGWRVKEKAPRAALILVWFEISTIVFIIILLKVFYKTFSGMMSVYEILNDLGVIFIFPLMLGLFISVIIIILFKIIKVLFNK